MDPDLKEALGALGRAIERREQHQRPLCPFCMPAPGPASMRWHKRAEDLAAARRIAGEQSRQTGRNYENFESGRYDHAFGVRTALAAIQYGRENP